jgi:hypothetical protein
LRAGVAISKVFFDLYALHKIHFTVDIPVNQFMRLLTTQCLPPFPSVW